MGFASGKQAVLERVANLRKGSAGGQAVVVGVEGFLYEVNESVWLEMSCLLLSDPSRGINLQTYTQPTTVEAK